MSIIDLLRTAFLNLWRRKLRAFLTVLGMVIGTSSIVVMVSLGVGMRQAMVDSYSSMGSLTTITVNNYRYSEQTGFEELKLDKKKVADIAQIPGVVAAMPRVDCYGCFLSGKYVGDCPMLAVDLEQAKLFGLTLEEGDFPSDKMSGGKVEMVMGQYVYNNFYNPNSDRWEQALDKDGNPKINNNSRIKLTFDYSIAYGYDNSYDPEYVPGKTYKVVPTGTVAEGNDFSYYCIVDMKVFEKIAKENPTYIYYDKKNFNTVLVKCSDMDVVMDVKAKIDEMGFQSYCLQESLEQSEESMKQAQYLLGAIGGVSLLVAAIGIMNTMMMSIYERTKEIGIIKVLGCRMGNIAGLFLTEAAYIGLFGGALGIGISYGLSTLLNKVLSSSGLYSLIPAYLAIGALVFSILVAMLSGLYPAFRAMKLSPLAAIRNE